MHDQLSRNIELKQLFKNIDSKARFIFSHQQTINLLQRTDRISSDILEVCQKKIRRKWYIDDVNSKKAIITQKRFDKLNVQIRQQFNFFQSQKGFTNQTITRDFNLKRRV